MDSDGHWSKPFEYTFTIRPPWWKTLWAYCVYGLIILVGVWIIHRYQKQRYIKIERNKALKKELEQAKEIEKAYRELESTHENLKSTQTQLVHAEKMASLGELTAGIAHEIQNPLNFVNNFSEVSVDLVEEMKEEISEGNMDQVNSIANDLNQNLQKIHHHGKRASSIVKGMLQHSRAGNGKKQPTDINAIVDEYIRLAYHGIRAKDKSFNADFKTDLDPNLPKINVVGQDIARVVLNLINNAFYAVAAKASTPGNTNYKPLVTIGTKKINGQVEISVKDNGLGIPKDIIDKIFQPFFTTKPTGQGTGLGLSMSYDIVKAHGGTLTVDSTEKEGAIFTIILPNN
jgi:signal transduction histidine kinase